MGLRLNGQLLVTEVGDDKRGRGGSEDGTLSLARKARETAVNSRRRSRSSRVQEHGRITRLCSRQSIRCPLEGGGCQGAGIPE